MECDAKTRQGPGTFVSPCDEETKHNQARTDESKNDLQAVSHTEKTTIGPAEIVKASKRSTGCLQSLGL